jgi:hypothetical protein
MTPEEISNARLMNQGISTNEFKNPCEVVKWMGAMQAQDFQMAKWAVGVRLQEPGEDKVESSINNGEIIRTHVLRPTWHFVAADDVYWMTTLSSDKIKSSMKSRHRELELTESLIIKTQKIIERSLSNRIFLTREELAAEFVKNKIRTDKNRLSHILFQAELDGLVCNGPMKGKKITYSLLEEWVPKKKEISRSEALSELARRYFTSRGPATTEDFIWWSNLSVSEARMAVDSVKADFTEEHNGSGKYLVPNSYSGILNKKTTVHLLPAYDEYLICYRDRSASLSPLYNKKTVSDNGIFYPVIVVNGQVEGKWKRIIQKNKVEIFTYFFHPPQKEIKKQADKKAALYGRFLKKEIEIKNNI